jgi:hypothetical protein
MNYQFMDTAEIGAMKDRLRPTAINLVYGERSLAIDPDETRTAMKSLNKPLQVWFINEHVTDPEERIEAVIRENGGDPAPWAPISTDVVLLYRLFIELTGERQPFLSLRVIDASYFDKSKSSVSSEWHRDCAALTLFTTYLGYGTQWTPDSNVKRDYFAKHQKQSVNDSDELLLHDPALVITTSIHGLGILKGELQRSDNDPDTYDFLSNFSSVDRDVDFNIGRGLIHRGPARASSDHRLLLTISTFVVPEFLKSAQAVE